MKAERLRLEQYPVLDVLERVQSEIEEIPRAARRIEHAHDVLANELAAAALPSQKFDANAAWFRLNVVLYNLLSAFKRLGLPEELHRIRPKRLRFLVLNTLARLICHARERLLRFADGFARGALDRFRVRIHARPPPLPG